jgi:hypothetical protein
VGRFRKSALSKHAATPEEFYGSAERLLSNASGAALKRSMASPHPCILDRVVDPLQDALSQIDQHLFIVDKHYFFTIPYGMSLSWSGERLKTVKP